MQQSAWELSIFIRKRSAGRARPVQKVRPDGNSDPTQLCGYLTEKGINDSSRFLLHDLSSHSDTSDLRAAAPNTPTFNVRTELAAHQPQRLPPQTPQLPSVFTSDASMGYFHAHAVEIQTGRWGGGQTLLCTARRRRKRSKAQSCSVL